MPTKVAQRSILASTESFPSIALRAVMDRALASSDQYIILLCRVFEGPLTDSQKPIAEANAFIGSAMASLHRALRKHDSNVTQFTGKGANSGGSVRQHYTPACLNGSCRQVP